MASNTTVESKTLEAFMPDLVTAICDDVQRITDQCLSTGLISDSRRRRILELKGSEDQARALIQCVQNSAKIDSHCFEIFLDSLDKELPRLVKEKLLSDMRKDLDDRTVVVHQAAVAAESSDVVKSTSETMIRSNLEDIKSRFSTLLIDVRLALKGNHVATINVRKILVGMFTGSDGYIPKTNNLEEIFDAATHHRLWDYWHHSPVEKLLCRFLPNHISLIREYKEHLSGYCAITKLIDYIHHTNIDHRLGQNELPLGSYTREQCRKLMVTLDIKRNITGLSLKYVQDLWERFAEEFDIPFLTAVLDSVLSGSLIITWLVPRDVAEKIVTSAHKSTSFFQAHDIVSVISTINIHVYSSKSQLTLQDQLLAAALGNKEGYNRILEQEMAIRSKMEEEMNSKIKDLEHKLERLESRMRMVPAPAAAGASPLAKKSPSKYYGDKPKLKNAFRELLPLAMEWKVIGTLLGLPEDILEEIKTYGNGPPDCLRGMLSEWFKQVESPTWKALADAVECINMIKAQDIRKHYLDFYDEVTW